MDIERFVEAANRLGDNKEKNEQLKRLFERFHLLNRNYLDKETYEKAQASTSAMVETIADTVRYLDGEITHLRGKRMKLPGDSLTLNEMQKVQSKNDHLLREYLQDLEK